MQWKTLKDVSRTFAAELPADLGSLDQHLDFILPKVIPFGEDLREEKFWIGKRWKEVRDDEGFHEAILHIFNSGGEYLLSLDGNVMRGSWKRLGESNSLLLEQAGRVELFDLRFLNSDFMVLTKHGDQVRKGHRKYFLLVHEPATRSPKGGDIDWRSLMEKLFNIWRENNISFNSWLLLFVVLFILAFLLLSR
ncbi:MAG: hypothetical protein NZM43_07145 [Saprospiraceae bacterium]|nr:hypothetical protein [Saprospiraceae bacterium]MDW8484085.1 hypothetical protein [Saprospiraceae bacterium]